MRMRRVIAALLCVCVLGTNDAMVAQATSIAQQEAVEQETSVEETIIEDETTEIQTAAPLLNYVVIDKPQIQAPDTQKIVMSIGDENTVIESAVLGYINENTGESLSVSASEMNGNAAVFSIDFADASMVASYRLLDITYRVNGVDTNLVFADAGMNMVFGVNTEVQTTPDAIVEEPTEEGTESVEVVTVDGDGEVTSGQSIEEAIEEAEEEVEQLEEADAGLISKVEDAVDEIVALAVEVKASNTSGTIKVVLDPGHDASHGGAVTGSYVEKDMNLAIALACKEELEKYSNVKVYMTRPGDACPNGGSAVDSATCNARRVEYAASIGADIYVSLHNNAGGGNGAEVYYPNANYNASIGKEGQKVAEQIQKKLVDLGLKDRGIKIRNSGDNTLYPDGSLADYYGVIRRCKLAGIPAIIVEHAFVDSSDAANFLSSPSKLKKLGIADATGIAKAYGLKIATASTAIQEVKSVGTGALSISWTESVAEKYEIYRSQKKDSGYSKIAEVAATNYTDKTVTPGRLYYYRVRTVNESDGEVNYGEFSNIKNGISYPKVEAIDAKNRSQGGVTISWNEVQYADYYQIIRRKTGESDYKKLAIVSADRLYYVDTTIENGSAYAYAIKAIGKLGYGSYGNIVKAVGMEAPTIKYAISNGTGKIKLSWNEVKYAEKYQVFRSTQKNGTYQLVGETNSCFYNNTKRTAGKTYYYKVRAVITSLGAKAKYSPCSAVKSATTLAKPVITNVGSAKSRALTVKWQNIAGADYYQVYRADKKNGTYTYVSTVKQNSYTDSGLSAGKTYYYSVRAVNKQDGKKGYSSFSSRIGGKVLGKVKISSVTSYSSSKMQIKWTGVTDATGYQIYRASGKSGYQKIAEVSSTQYIDKKLTAGQYYKYRVCAVNRTKGNVGYGSYSSTKYARVLAQPNIVNVRSVTSTKLQITWDAVNGANEYEVYRSTGSSAKLVAVVDTNTYTDSYRTTGKKYYYRVRARYSQNGITGKSSFGEWKSGSTMKQVTGVMALAQTSGETQITWSAVKGATSYQIARSTTRDGKYQIIKNIKSVNCVDTNVNAVAQTYYYKVRALKDGINGREYGSYSNVTAATTGYSVMGETTVTTAQMVAYYNRSGKVYPSHIYTQYGAKDIQTFCNIVIQEAMAEGVRAEVLFAQICKETGYLQFGGDVQPTQCNFGGLGATGNGVPGNSFPNVRTGIRAQVQHLKAYGSTAPLNQACVDTRFSYVPRGSAVMVEWLGIPDNPTGRGWAAAAGYGYDLVDMIKVMKLL